MASIEQQDSRLVGQGASQGQPLTLPTGEISAAFRHHCLEIYWHVDNVSHDGLCYGVPVLVRTGGALANPSLVPRLYP